jgi:hypothetical protein
MSGAAQEMSDAVAALVRKSRISLVLTLVILGLLGGSIAYLSVQIFAKRQELTDLNSERDAAKQEVGELQAQIEQKKAELNTATAQASAAAIKQFVRRLDNTGRLDRQAIRTAADDASKAGRLVYLQYSNTTAAAAMTQLQDALVAAGYVAPGVEKLSPRAFDKTTPNIVRYFHAEDESAAGAIARLAEASFAKNCPGKAIALVPQLAQARNPKATTQIEIWVASGCHRPA